MIAIVKKKRQQQQQQKPPKTTLIEGILDKKINITHKVKKNVILNG